MLAGFRIRSIVTAGTLALVAIIAISAVMAMSGARMAMRDLSYQAENLIPSVDLVGRTTVDFEVARVRLSRLIMADTAQERVAANADLNKALDKVDREVAQYASLISDAQDERNYHAYQQGWKQFRAGIQQDAALAMRGQISQAARMYQEDLVRGARKLQDAFDVASRYNMELSQGYARQSVDSANNSMLRNAALGAVGLAIGLLILLLFSRRVTRPLMRLRDAMLDMAGGHPDIAIPGSDKPDELGEIARALEGIKISIARRAQGEAEAQIDVQRQVTGALETALAALKDGRLNHRIAEVFPQEYEQLRSDFNSTIQVLGVQMDEVSRASAAVRNGAGEIAMAAGDLARRTENQANSLGETAVTVKGLTASVSEARQAAGTAANAAQDTEQEASNSGKLMQEAVAAMNSIAATSDRMRSIVDVIDGISFQTNLLALNAGVEAARAGDAGRGFAVVASEVRNLAERSAEAAKEIGELIVNSGKEVHHGVQMVSQTQASLLRIVQKASDLSGMIGGIAQGTARQADAIAQVNSVIADLDSATQHNAALVEESTAASQSLATESERLEQVVGRFAVDAGQGVRLAPAPFASAAKAAQVPAAPRRPAAATLGNTALAQEDWSEF